MQCESKTGGIFELRSQGVGRRWPLSLLHGFHRPILLMLGDGAWFLAPLPLAFSQRVKIFDLV